MQLPTDLQHEVEEHCRRRHPFLISVRQAYAPGHHVAISSPQFDTPYFSTCTAVPCLATRAQRSTFLLAEQAVFMLRIGTVCFINRNLG